MREATRRVSTVLLAFIAAVTLFVAYSIGNIAQATHQPADKTAATGSDLNQVNDATPVLTETMRVSSPADLILQVSAECSILTELTTGPSDPGGIDSATAIGSVRLWVEIDGKRVPVASDDTAVDGPEEDEPEPGSVADPSDIGEVTFCNRAYQRTVTDTEDDPDGQDTEHDFIRTRTANAFNWFALDAGGDFYDADGDNLLTIRVMADFDETEVGDAVADAFVGSRTLIVEAVHAANDESVGPGPVESPSAGTGATGPGGGKPKD